ncbi:MAG: SphA family protein [Panacagrimonas sp.]
MCITLLSPSASAGEGGLSNFPYGAQTTYAAFLPPPGTTNFFGYSLFYTADSVRDDKGDRIPGIEVDVIAVAPRLVHTWKPLFAGFKLSSGILIEGLTAKVKVPGAEDRAEGPTLWGIEPLYLTRSFGAWHFLTGGIIYFPIGSYERNDIANHTLNYHSYAYQASTTWTPSPKWDVSLNAAVEFKDRNKDNRYRSGTQAGLTFGVGHRPFENQKWDLGVSGFYTQQLTDDEIGRQETPNGTRTRKFAIGPKAAYFFTPAVAVVAQWHRETNVRNAPQGDLFWLECAIPF